jgi:hypothetical protein
LADRRRERQLGELLSVEMLAQGEGKVAVDQMRKWLEA